MFGTNPLRRVVVGAGDELDVQAVFGTIQGEGPLAGSPSVFVRLWGCNLRCHFCDTDFESSTWRPSLDELFARIKAQDVCADLIVLTGGEPLRQPIGKFIERALDSSWRVQIETAGTVWPESMYSDSVQRRLHEGSLVLVCSPKTGRVHAQIERWCRHFKYITCAADDGPITAVRESTQTRGLRAKLYVPFNDATIWLQPRMDYTPTGAVDTVATEANTQQAVRLCMRYGYRLSLQTHKLLGVE